MIYVDADGCPVKDEIYKVAERMQIAVVLVANRELMQNLRHMGENRGGPAPMDKKARSQFLSSLDQILHALNKVV